METRLTTIVEGVYKDGKIELLQPPQNLPEGRVRVVLIADDRLKPPPHILTYGKFPGDTSTLDDFNEAQWRGEKEFDSADGQ
jgi:hypothetical protein